jgi:hypothetical protein
MSKVGSISMIVRKRDVCRKHLKHEQDPPVHDNTVERVLDAMDLAGGLQTMTSK